MNPSFPLFSHTLEGLTFAYCFALVFLIRKRQIHPKLDRQFSLLLISVGIHYFARLLAWYRIEHWTAVIFPSILFTFLVRLFKIETSLKTRLGLFCAAILLLATSLFGDFHQTKPWLVLLFTYQTTLLLSLTYLSAAHARRAKHPIEAKFYRNCAYWVFATFLIMGLDWVFSRFLGLPRISTLFVFPFSFWIIFIFGAGGLRSARKEFFAAFLEIVPLNIIVVLLLWFFSNQTPLELASSSFLLFVAQFGIWILKFRENRLDRFSNRAPPTAPILDTVKDLTSLPWLSSVRWLKVDELYALGVLPETVARFFSQEEPAIRPIDLADWMRIDTLKFEEREAFLFVWDALQMDALIYCGEKKGFLGVKLHSFAYSVDYREKLYSLSEVVRQREC